jgi:nucleotide-binding universal stress UspA family protein
MGEPQATATKVDRLAPILVGIDGTAASWDALAWAEQELASRSADAGPRRLVMCRVYPLDTPGARLPNPPDMAWLALLDPGLYRRLRLIRQRRPDDDITLDVAAGSVAAQMIARTAPGSVAVIAAPTRDIAVVARVAAHARGVVVAVRPTTPPIEVTASPFAGHVVVGVDGGPSSRAAVRFAFDYAARHRCPVAAVYAEALDPAGAWVEDNLAQIHLMPHAFDLDLLEGAVMDAHHAHPGVRVRRFVLRERAQSALVSASSGAALLVVGDRGRNAVARRVLGSVSRHVIRQAHCSVAVVHDTGGSS